MIAWVSPDRTVRSTPFRISVRSSPSPTVTCRSRITSSLMVGTLQLGGEAQSGLDGGHDLPLDVRDADALDDVGEEAADDEAPGLVLGNAAGLQVEQLQVVEAAGGAGVAGAGDVAGLDLEVGHRVGAGAVGQQQVAVHLVGLRAGRRRADTDVADPHGAGRLAEQRVLVEDVGRAVRGTVVDEQPALEVLRVTGEADA